MIQVKIFWAPTSLTVDSLGKKRFLRATDGDARADGNRYARAS